MARQDDRGTLDGTPVPASRSTDSGPHYPPSGPPSQLLECPSATDLTGDTFQRILQGHEVLPHADAARASRHQFYLLTMHQFPKALRLSLLSG